MDLPKLIAAITIAIFLSFFISETISLIYKPPKISTGNCDYPSSTECTQIITDKCGTYNRDDYTTYTQCRNDAYSSQEYLDCTERTQEEYQNCLSGKTDQMRVYQIITLIIYGILGLLSILFGFVLIKYQSIGSGLILGGTFVIIFSSFISTYTTLLSSALSIFGGSEISNTIFQIIRVLFYAIALTILTIMSYQKLEKTETRKTHNTSDYSNP